MNRATTHFATDVRSQYIFRNAHKSLSTAIDKDVKYLYRAAKKDESTPQYKVGRKKRGMLRKLPLLANIMKTNEDYKAAALQLYRNGQEPRVFAAIAFVLQRKDCTKLTDDYKEHLEVLAQEQERQYQLKAQEQPVIAIDTETVAQAEPQTARPLSPRARPKPLLSPRKNNSLKPAVADQPAPPPQGLPYLKTAAGHLAKREELLAEKIAKGRSALARRHNIPEQELIAMAKLLDDTWGFKETDFEPILREFTSNPSYSMGEHPISAFLHLTPILAFVDDTTARKMAQMAEGEVKL